MFFCFPAQAANTVTYQYDAIGRITQITRDDGVAIHYSYDPNGNRTQQQVSSNTLAQSGIPQTGWWWDTTQTGSGFAIETTPAGVSSVAPFMYDANGLPLWYSSLGTLAGGVYDTGLFQYQGGQSLGLTRPNPVVTTAGITVTGITVTGITVTVHLIDNSTLKLSALSP